MDNENKQTLEKCNGNSLLSGINLSALTEEQKNVIAEKIIDKKLELEVEQINAQRKRNASSIDMDDAIKIANDLSATKNDFSVSCNTNTASGKTNFNISSHNNHLTYIIIAIFGIIILIFLIKGLI